MLIWEITVIFDGVESLIDVLNFTYCHLWVVTEQDYRYNWLKLLYDMHPEFLKALKDVLVEKHLQHLHGHWGQCLRIGRLGVGPSLHTPQGITLLSLLRKVYYGVLETRVHCIVESEEAAWSSTPIAES